jgi:ABC-type polysaccharide/polyol phosphate transport system ATPase subunit
MRTRIDAIGAFIRLCFAVATSVLPDILLMGEWLSLATRASAWNLAS